MKIILYISSSDSNHVSKNLTELSTVDGFLRDNTSIIAPSITVQDDSAISANYAYIPDFSRYYYINDVSVTPTNLYTLHLSVDVLMSFKNYFLRLDGIIARQENICNLYLDDDKFLVTSQRMYVTKAFPKRVLPASEGGLSFILTLAGGKDNSIDSDEA